MKVKHFILFSFIAMLWSSCNKDDSDYEIISIATPELMSKAEFRSSVEVLGPQNIEEAGKIYAYKDFIFVNDALKGIHIIDDSNPENPQAKAYLKIPGNVDISVKNNYLYADSAIDLVVFDISDINNIVFVNRLEDVFSVYDHQIPEGVEYADYSGFDFNSEVIVGWEIKQERRLKNNDDNRLINVVAFSEASNMDGARVGQGGSLARFQIVNNYLYTVGSYEMAIFNIQNSAQPALANTQYSGWNIETMFQADGYLYLGSTNGMYIYSLSNPALPEFVSQFTHWEGCDPVVVDGDYAYVTLRGGNACGQQESVLEVIDIKDKANPTLAARYELVNPYGLGVKDNLLFVSDGTAGLKLFNKADPLNIKLIKQFQAIQAKDVIPLNDILLMIGENMLYQYEYKNNDIYLISEYQL
tara:strand:+ start:1290 stop:2531 length:1242 start_codon:yes stop_codon:yes gene_type:complete